MLTSSSSVTSLFWTSQKRLPKHDKSGLWTVTVKHEIGLLAFWRCVYTLPFRPYQHWSVEVNNSARVTDWELGRRNKAFLPPPLIESIYLTTYSTICLYIRPCLCFTSSICSLSSARLQAFRWDAHSHETLCTIVSYLIWLQFAQSDAAISCPLC